MNTSSYKKHGRNGTSVVISGLAFIISLSMMITSIAGCKISTDDIDLTIDTTIENTIETSGNHTIVETSRETTTKETIIESLEETNEESTEESAEESTTETQEETTKETTRATTVLATQPPQTTPQIQEKPKSPYYLYAEKGSYTLGVYALDGNNNYTNLVKKIGRASCRERV